jgi:hypothetical protein
MSLKGRKTSLNVIFSKPSTPEEVGAWRDESPKGTGAW